MPDTPQYRLALAGRRLSCWRGIVRPHAPSYSRSRRHVATLRQCRAHMLASTQTQGDLATHRVVAVKPTGGVDLPGVGHHVPYWHGPASQEMSQWQYLLGWPDRAVRVRGNWR